jgi:asparagine synthase (glutamine-hydrolysing)
MCGIAGLLGVEPDLARPAADRMLAALRHRGPNDEGVEHLPNPVGAGPPLVLVHTRLAILDLSAAGHQPMPDPSVPGPARPWVVFNGEIYNFEDVRDELAAGGLVTRTGTDTEVILLAHRRWGPDAVERFRGMFAYALTDPSRRQVRFVRDRLGIKPLYFLRPPGGGLLFASEVRALLAAGPELAPRRLDPKAVEAFLAQGVVYGGDAHLLGARALGPGEVLTTDWSGRPVWARRYWQVPVPAGPRPTRPAAVAELGRTLREAVRQHLIADVPVGVFLSGGVDSTAITTLATELSRDPVRTVSIGFDQATHDETGAAEEFARELGTDHRTVRLTGDVVRGELDRLLAAMDVPTTDGVNTFYAARAARDAGVTVALSGLGGDEVFGGYQTFRDIPRARRLMGLFPGREMAGPAFRWLGKRLGSRAGAKLAEALARPGDPVHLYLLRREVFLPAERRLLMPLPPGSDPVTGVPPETLAELREACAGRDPENQVSALELTGYMRHTLLRDSDVFSMAQGLELRVPLVDHRLVELVAPLPGAWKRFGGLPKPLLLEAAGPRLPKKVGRLPKRGFMFPWEHWFRGDLSPAVEERLTDRGVWAAVGIDPSGPGKLWGRFRRGDPTVTGFQVLALTVLADVVARQHLAAA